MRILVVAATEEEVSPLISEFGISISEFFGSAKADKKGIETELFNTKSEIEHPKFEISLLITGVGMVATAFALGKHLPSNRYDLVLNLGIAGSFDRDIALGEVIEITEDTFAELGAEDDAAFLSIDQMGFGEATYHLQYI
jgi:nucleoside phosphorylase